MTEKQKVTPNMKAAKNESGKSMVEMLGVLALMGLLAILGAKGYDIAMERAMANNIINEVNRRSVVYSQQMIANGDLSSTEFENEKNLGSSVVTGEKLGSQLFRVKVTEVSSASCRHIINSGYDRPIQITADDVVVTKDNLEACGELETTMGFVFTKELRPCADCLAEGVTACAGDYECPRNQSCQNGVCRCLTAYQCGTICCGEYQQCENGTCVDVSGNCTTNRDCQEDEFCKILATKTGGASCSYTHFRGSCQKIGEIIEWQTTDNQDSFYYTEAHRLSYWAAKNWCQAIGAHLASMNEACPDWDGTLGERVCAHMMWGHFGDAAHWLDKKADNCSGFWVSSIYGQVGLSDLSSNHMFYCHK